MFNDKYFLTQAVLERKKTMTRRLVPDKTITKAIMYEANHINTKKTFRQIVLGYATYKTGEIVAIAQSYETLAIMCCIYETMDRMFSIKKEYIGAGWKNKMFVKSEFMPHHIMITNIRLEYLQDISDEDCLKEGILKFHMFYVFQERLKKIKNFILDTPREAFRILFDKVSGKGIWDNNPLVYVYEFELID